MRLTAEFEMGSGSGHTAQTTRPAQDKMTFGKRIDGLYRRVFGLFVFVTGPF